MDTIEISIDQGTYNRLTKLSQELNVSELSVIQLAVKVLEQEAFMEQVISDFESLRSDESAWSHYVNNLD
jgi:hypothetical protein